MITGWGAHHIDSAHWAMDTEYTGPIEVWGTAEFPTKGLWDVHGPFKTEAIYADGVHMIVSGEFPNGIKFIGSDGWIFVSRGNEAVTASDPVRQVERSEGPGRQRSEDHHVGDRTGRDPLLRERNPSRELARVRALAPAAHRAGRGRPPILHGLPDPSHGDEVEAQAALGSGQGTVQERRRGECDAVEAAEAAVYHVGVRSCFLHDLL